MMGSAVRELPFLDFGNAPELFAHDVRGMEVIADTLHVTFVMERMHNGERVHIAAFHVSMPLKAVPDAWALTARIVGGHVELPQVAKQFMRGETFRMIC